MIVKNGALRKLVGRIMPCKCLSVWHEKLCIGFKLTKYVSPLKDKNVNWHFQASAVAIELHMYTILIFVTEVWYYEPGVIWRKLDKLDFKQNLDRNK